MRQSCSQYSDRATGSGRAVRYFPQSVEPILPADADVLYRSFQILRSEAADLSVCLSVLHSVSPYFRTSVPFLPKYLGSSFGSVVLVLAQQYAVRHTVDRNSDIFKLLGHFVRLVSPLTFYLI